jgi:hypothetical protein
VSKDFPDFARYLLTSVFIILFWYVHQTVSRPVQLLMYSTGVWVIGLNSICSGCGPGPFSSNNLLMSLRSTSISSTDLACCAQPVVLFPFIRTGAGLKPCFGSRLDLLQLESRMLVEGRQKKETECETISLLNWK